MNKKIEVENGELALENEFGDIIIVPTKYAMEVRDMVKEGCNDCIDNLATTLPKMENYAEDGTVIQGEPGPGDPPKKRLSKSFFRPNVEFGPEIPEEKIELPKKKKKDLVSDEEFDGIMEDVRTSSPRYLEQERIRKQEEEEKEKNAKIDAITSEIEKPKLKSVDDIKNPVEKLPELQGTYRMGDRNDDVETLQRKLIKSGYLSDKTDVGKDNADGIYGNITYNAIRKFQKDNGLKEDGIAGKNTLAALAEKNKSTEMPSAPNEVEETIKSPSSSRVNNAPLKKDLRLPEEEEEVEPEIYERNGVKRHSLKGVVFPKRQGTMRATFNEVVPTSGRMLINDLSNRAWNKLAKDKENVESSDFNTITEEHIANSELTVLKDLTGSLLKKGKTAIKSYDDYRNTIGMEGKSIEDGLYLSNAANTIGQTLGRASIDIDENGNIFIEDTYDFNDASDEKEVTYEQLGKKRNMDPDEVGYSKALYSIARNTGGVYGSPDGKGAKVSIHIGHINQFDFDEESLNKIKSNYDLKNF